MPDRSAIDDFRTSLKGHLVLPEDADYDEVRAVWNGMIDRRPALIARCQDADDVVSAVNFARDQGLRVSVRCGGHSVAGKSVCDDGLMIDLSQMNSVTVDPEAKTARVDGGVCRQSGATEGHQGEVRSGQLLQRQPEHRAGRTLKLTTPGTEATWIRWQERELPPTRRES